MRVGSMDVMVTKKSTPSKKPVFNKQAFIKAAAEVTEIIEKEKTCARNE